MASDDVGKNVQAAWLELARVAGRNEFHESRVGAIWRAGRSTLTCAALIVCVVIVSLFVEEFFQTNLKWFVGGLFVSAMVALICGLFGFSRKPGRASGAASRHRVCGASRPRYNVVTLKRG